MDPPIAASLTGLSPGRGPIGAAARSLAARWLVAAALAYAGCSVGYVSGDDLPAPTVDEPPAQTASPTLLVTGTKTAGTLVWVHVDGEADARAATGDASGATWSLNLNLRLGDNLFVAYATDPDLLHFSPQVGPFTVALVSAVDPPTLDPVLTPTTVSVQTIGGTKPTDTSVHLSVNGGPDREIVPRNVTTTWSYDLALVEGTNDLELRAWADQFSTAISGAITLDTTPPFPPLLTTGDTVTDAATITVTGTHAADGNVCLRRDQEPDCIEVIPADGSSTINLDLPVSPGANYLCFSSIDYLGNASMEVCITVTVVAGPTVIIHAPGAGEAVVTTTVDVDAEIIADEVALDTGSIQVCLGASPCSAGVALAAPNHFGATLDLSGATSGETLTITVDAADTAGIHGSSSVDVLYAAGATIVSVSAAPGHSTNPALVGAGGALYLVWADECSQFATCDVSPGNLPLDIFYRSRSGAAWGPTQLVSDGGGTQSNDGDSRAPAIAVDSAGDVHVVWSERGDVAGSGTDADVLHRVLAAASGTFGSTTVVTTGNASNDTAPALAAGGDGSVHLAWVRAAGADRNVYYARWTTGGGWESPLLVSDDADDGDNTALPAIGVDGDGNAHVAWQDDGDIAGSGTDLDVIYRKVTGGTTLGTTVVVSDNGQDNIVDSDSRAPTVLINGADVVIAWEETGNILASGADTDVFLRVYDTDQQPAASQYTLISSGSAVSSTSVALGRTSAGNVVAAWAEGDGAATDVVYCVAQSGYFFAATTVASTAEVSSNPTVAVDGADNAHVIWEDLTTPTGFVGDDLRPGTNDPDIDLLYAIQPTSP